MASCNVTSGLLSGALSTPSGTSSGTPPSTPSGTPPSTPPGTSPVTLLNQSFIGLKEKIASENFSFDEIVEAARNIRIKSEESDDIVEN